MLKTVAKLCEEAQLDQHRVYELAARKVDPLPLRYLRGDTRYGRVIESEFEEWWLRNSVQYQERRNVEQ